MSEIRLDYTDSQINQAVSWRHNHENVETLNKFGENNGQPTYSGKMIGEKQFNWRGSYQLGNTYNTNDVVMGLDGNDYIAVMDGVVLPPPSMGWDLFLQGSQGITPPPNDDKIYGMRNGEWVELSGIIL